ncbi:glucan endo-1,3-beta-glucosidase-like [Andrographis paniculata]|uniref:glucan endo-1,3-beta-glucosidase-like n=1 Tax=Andrographis paniculata TaxID=175694 RepID=UPI0021E919A2|nr:glucan endo-1,3-beta-glucosidase-like [Andrographis paniculata]
MAGAAVVLLLLLAGATAANSIGVNYGTQGDNLPPPSDVAKFLKEKTIIDRIKIFDANPDILGAFAGTGILVAVTVPNGDIPGLADLGGARRWISANILPFHPRTKINYILVGNEILHWGPQNLRDNLVAAVRTLHEALRLGGVRGVKVTTAHSLGILESSSPPSLARFRRGWDTAVLAPLLQFHRETKTPFMVNPYPYFGYNAGAGGNADFATLRPNKGFFDKFVRRTYGDMFDLLMDAVYMSMKRLGYGDVEIAVGETGWASQGEAFEQPKCSPENAAAYNGGLIRKYNSGRGTPLMPKRRFETYLFGLFNEDQKTGPLSEKNFGLFRSDFSPVYDVGLLRTAAPSSARPIQKPKLSGGIQNSKKWCVPKPGSTDAALQANIDYVCNQPGFDCEQIKRGGACYEPNTVRAHAAYIMNLYYQSEGRNDFNCDFSSSGFITSIDPSVGSCKFLS